MTPLPGEFVMPDAPTLGMIGIVDPRIERAVHRLANSLQVTARVTAGSGEISFELRDPDSDSQAYQLRIEPSGVTVTGAGPAGLFHGIQTLQQIADREQTRWHCCAIDDAPDLAIRGLSLDVSRGRVPTMDTLRRLVDRLAAMKINHLQLYIEHTFDFRFDPDIARDCSPLTHDDIRQLDAYCRDRFIDLVPSLATFGHMGRILSLPRYRHLAEIEATQTWESQSWPQRLRGLTIDARGTESRKLLEAMLDEYLPLFSSGFANVNADETHDLGSGRNRAYCARVGRGRLYVDHLLFLSEVCGRHGKRMMFWGDVIRNHPDLLSELPADAVMLDWGYDADADFPAVRSSARADRDVCVCPGTIGWNRLINDLGTSHANISNAATAAEAHHASGMIVTDWGDHGHFNLPACSLPAIALAAARAWNLSPVPAEELDRAIETFVFGSRAPGIMAALCKVARAGEACQTWCRLYQPLADSEALRTMDQQTAASFRADATAAMALIEGNDDDTAEWRLACRASVLLADKIAVAHALGKNGRADAVALRHFADDVDQFIECYTSAWLVRNRPNRLEDVTGVLAVLAHEARQLCH